MAFLYVGNREDALDIVQETAYKAYRSIRTLKKEKYFSTWLMRILINTAYEHLRTAEKTIDLDVITDNFRMEENDRITTLDLLAAIKKLRKEYQEVLILFYFQDLPIKDIAHVMNIPIGSVKTYLFRGKNELKNLMEGESDYGKERFS